MILLYLLASSNPFLSSYNQSDLFGKCIFLSLFALSIISWSLLIYKLWRARSMRKNSLITQHYFRESRDYPLALKFGSPKGSNINPFLEIYQTLKQGAMEYINKNQEFTEDRTTLSNADIEALGMRADHTISSLLKSLEDKLFILATVVGLAPLLGLLGTVWGILITLGELHAHHSVSNEAMLGGLSMALGTTVLGLLVAIPALVGYNAIKAQLRNLQLEMEGFSSDVLSAIELHYRSVEVR